MMMTPNKTNLAQGTNIEILLGNVLPNHPKAFAQVKAMAGIDDKAKVVKAAENIGQNKRKTDMTFDFGEDYPPLRISVKSFKGGAGYNHLMRKSLPAFCRDNRIKKADEEFLTKCFLRKAEAFHGRGTPLIDGGEEKDRVREIFANLEIAASSLLGADHPQVLAIFSIAINKWHFYDIQRQVLPLIRQSYIAFTVTSSNIMLGDYIVLQRKGSASGENSGGHPVTDIRHRANDVQIKMKVNRFFDEVKPAATIKLDVPQK